jgi:hypothetical protein
MVKQSGWDETRHIGQFAGQKITVKLNLSEIGELLDMFNNNRSYSKPHSNGVQVRFAPYIANEVQKGYGISISKKEGEVSTNWLGSFNFAEKEVVVSYLNYVLRMIFNFEETEMRKAYKDRQEKLPKQTEKSQITQTKMRFHSVIKLGDGEYNSERNLGVFCFIF